MPTPERTDNLLTETEKELLGLIIEECSEIIQAATKIKRLDEPTELRYTGKYQNQDRGPQVAR